MNRWMESGKLKKEQISLQDRQCIVYSDNAPRVFMIQPVNENEIEGLDDQVELISRAADAAVLFVAVKIEDWNEELSPWNAPPVFGNVEFGSGGKETLEFIKDMLIPHFMTVCGLENDIPVILGGYSLAALFSIWSAYQTERFAAIAAASPSVWFPGWIRYADSFHPQSGIIYLSLGDREEKTKNKQLAVVGACIRDLHEKLMQEGITTILEWNKGSHFNDSARRCADAFCWCIHQLK